MNAQNIGQILDALAARFSVPAAHLWAILVRQAYVDAFVTFVGFLVASVITALLWQKARRVAEESHFDAETWYIAAYVAAAACGVLFIVLLSDVSHALNPEYYALTKILGAIGAAGK